ncbi:hypothetical protein Patl1_33218 [Pistacia atlantica]|uniref:Uncharacterized protein n=1 Tax=Pistacia atlantica TaxID=434234 RepID=A0ACC1AMF5_9ROSI|nr:hypothetical protein Patl1_33218 [Pistacia atlantica]
MEIDLELPSREQEKIENGSSRNEDFMDGVDRIHVLDGDMNSPSTSEPVEEGCMPSASEGVTGGAGIRRQLILSTENMLDLEASESLVPLSIHDLVPRQAAMQAYI